MLAIAISIVFKTSSGMSIVPFSSIIEAVYPDGLQEYEDVASKERFIWDHTINICNAMKDNTRFFVDYDADGINSKGEKFFRFKRK